MESLRLRNCRRPGLLVNLVKRKDELKVATSLGSFLPIITKGIKFLRLQETKIKLGDEVVIYTVRYYEHAYTIIFFIEQGDSIF